MATIQHNGAERKLTPLLMKDFLVAQTLKGLKTQTRRLNGLKEVNITPDLWIAMKTVVDGYFTFITKPQLPHVTQKIKSPYGKIGDVIWVREMWSGNKELGFDYNKNDGFKPVIGWKPSIHMPKEACRLFLEITDIRPERLQDITEEDASAEGVEKGICPLDEETLFKDYLTDLNIFYTGRPSFYSLWRKINGDGAWEANPWVWRISFKVIPKPANWPA